MKSLFPISSFLNRVHLLWAAHYSKVTGKPSPSGFSYTIFDSIAKLPAHEWDQAHEKQDVFLSTSYLQALELAPPHNMNFRYAIVRDKGNVIGIVYFQILQLDYHIHLSIMRMLKIDKRLAKPEKESIDAEKTRIRLLVCGNVMLSGEHGFCMKDISFERAMQVIAEIAYDVRTSCPHHIEITLVKDFYRKKDARGKPLMPFGFSSFDAGPNMVITIRPNWRTFDEYLNDMKPKYRKRAESALKKGKTIERRSLSLDDIIHYKKDLYDLYSQVADNAKFKIYAVSPEYFIELKRNLGAKFECVGLFLNNDLIGFTTRIFNTPSMEGYIHGIRYELNKRYELYQNILLGDIRAAIAARVSEINTGRTSIAMKSSIGAIPNNMDCYMRFSGKISNHFFSHIMYFIKPSTEQARDPFK
jgi:hypothetical protein